MAKNIMMERFALVGLDLSGPFTPERLLAISAQARERYEALSIEFPAGTAHVVRNAAGILMEQAEMAARWMSYKGLASAMHIGPFDARLFRRGMRVRIPAGVALRSMHPKDHGGFVTKRARVVTLHDCHCGYIDGCLFPRSDMSGADKRIEESVRHAEVVWAGTGGYWLRANASDVELIDASASTEQASKEQMAAA